MRRRSAGLAMRAAKGEAVTAGAEPRGKIGFHGGKIELERPRVRNFDGQELPLPSWERASEAD